MKNRYILFLILGLDTLFLLLKIDELSISYYEAEVLYGSLSFLQLFVKTSLYIFGNNDFALRLPMLLLHIMSVVLMYKISKNYVKVYRNRVWIILIFVLLPGTLSSAIIVNEAGVLIFFLLVFIYMYENHSKKLIYPLLASYLFISGGFAYLYLSLVVFSIYKKEKNFFVFNLLLFLLSLYMFGINTHGTPRGHFLDSLAIYAAIFSPIVFIYLFYVLYRRYLVKDIDMLWFIASVTLSFSLLLSFRQKVNIEFLAPYLMVSLPLIAQTFEHSYRVRLSMFRQKYRLAFIVSLIILLINSSVVFFNQYLYHFIDEPEKHFSYKMHVAKELAKELKSKGIDCVNTDERMQVRLFFYGVTKCNKYILTQDDKPKNTTSDVTISYKNVVVYNAHVTKLNIN
jgi:hypothetical protein